MLLYWRPTLGSYRQLWDSNCAPAFKRGSAMSAQENTNLQKPFRNPWDGKKCAPALEICFP